ncbi:MAG: hypothetical protein JWQ98_2087 [Chlorobi bacterium]|nr:hypothetical protein [Chlorobiota bacterium]
MTCKEIHEQITAYVDNRVDEHEYREKVQQHIKYCPDCRAAYELELMTKTVVHDRAPRSVTPDGLRQSIAGQVGALSDERKSGILNGAAQPEQGWFDRFGDIFLSPVGVAIASILVIAGAWGVFGGSKPQVAVLDSPPASVSAGDDKPHPDNFFNKANENYRAIADGHLVPQLATHDSRELTDFFKENGVGYGVIFLPARAPLTGGVVSNHGDAHFAHLIYGGASTIYYVFEVPQATLKQGKVFYITDDIMQRLDRGEDIWEEPSADARLVMFKKGDIICAMVSNAPRASMEQFIGGRS